MFLKLFMCL